MDTQFLRQTFRPTSHGNISSRPSTLDKSNDLPRQPQVSSRPAAQAGAVPAQQILAQRLDQSLRPVASVPASAAGENYAAQDFSPSAVAHRVLGFIQNQLNQVDAGQRSTVLEQAKIGIEQGFSEAREILDELGMLSQNVMDDIDNTYAQILSGVENIASAPPAPPPALQQIASQSAQYERSEQTAIEIVTQEGDRVTVQVGLTSAVSSTQSQVTGNGLSVQGSVTNTQEQSQLHYTVEGALSKDEQKAIDKLLHKIDKIAGNFYEGNVDKALQKAQKLGFNDEQIAQFSVSMSFQESIAVSAYQETAGQGAPALPTQDVQAVGSFIQQLDALMDSSSHEKLLGDVVSSLQELMKTFLTLKDPAQLAQDPAEFTDQALAHSVVDTVLANRAADQVNTQQV